MKKVEKSEERSLEDRVVFLEARIETLWTEIFSAWALTVEKGLGTRERETLRGAVLILCDQSGLAYPGQPWDTESLSTPTKGEKK